MMNTGYDCICTRLVTLGIVDALTQAPNGDALLDAIQACMQDPPCKKARMELPEDAQIGEIKPRERRDRRTCFERREHEMETAEDRRDGVERRVNQDRRGLQAGHGYTPEEMYVALKIWCADNCKGAYKLWVDESNGGKALRFHFEQDADRMAFMAMLRNFKKPTLR